MIIKTHIYKLINNRIDRYFYTYQSHEIKIYNLKNHVFFHRNLNLA